MTKLFCDKCGTPIEADENVTIRSQPNTDLEIDWATYDLCDKCVEWLINMIEGGQQS